MRLLPLLLALALPAALLAQDDDGSDANAIHASTVLHEDGTRTETVTDPEKHTSEAETYDSGNRLMQKVVYTLDDQNQATSGIVYNAKGQALYKSAYKRDDSNRISEEDDYSMDNQLIRRYVYEFGPNGKVSRIRAFDGQGNELQPVNGDQGRPDRHRSLPYVHQ
ncbi:MAG TPA: hypothetical protein VHY22_03305 [Chthoniobacteraceae bacterium]|jgi:hypothetical protein|nr:hypothetical protein [Chthoniobacteraceae bacterium]